MNDFERLITSPKGMNSDIGEEHWLWRGAINSNGYGGLGQTAIHVAAFEHFHRALEPNEHVRHKCDIRNCFNPNCLESGSREDNMRDMILRKRGNTVRLSPDDVRYIRANYIRRGPKGGRSNRKELADRFNLSPSYIKHIISGKVWGWINE